MIVVISILEILLLCLGASVLIYRTQLRISEALSSGIIITFITLSLIFQTAFLLGQPNLAFALEGVLIIISLFILKKRSKYLIYFYQRFKNFSSQYKLIVGLLSIPWTYLGLQAVLLPPANWDSMTYNLARVMLFQQEKSLYLTEITTHRQAVFPVGSDILHHIFLRFYTDYGIGIFSFLAYVSIGLGTYALCRRYTSSQISLMATLVIISLPEVVYQSTSTKNDIITAATAIFCFLTVHRLLEKLTLTDVILLTLGLAFGISAKTSFLGFILPFSLFFGLLLLKKYKVGVLIKLIADNSLPFILLIIPIVILSQLWLFIHNHYFWGGWSGAETFTSIHKQSDGLKGAVANLVRYVFQSVHFLKLGDILFESISGLTLSNTLQNTYDSWLQPLLGDAGIGKDFTPAFNILWTPHEDLSWFGPFGFLLVIPGIIYSILRGKKSLQALSLTLMGYAVILCYKVVWMPWNGRFFSLFFAASGVCVAYFIESVKFKRKFLIKSISYASILILFLSCAVNESKPLNIIPNQTLTGSHLIPLKWAHNIMHESIWAKTNWGRNRLYYAENHYFYRDKNSRLLDFKDTIPPESNIVLVAGEDSWIYHYLLSNPDQKFTPVSLLLNPDVNPLDFDYLLCIDEECRYRKFNVNENTLLDLISSTQPGELIELKHRVKIEGN